MSETAVVARPFCTLRTIARERPGGPTALIVTPFSGQQAAIFGDVVETLAPDHEVYVTDWVDAVRVSLTEGGFDLDDMVGYILAPGLIGPGATSLLKQLNSDRAMYQKLKQFFAKFDSTV